MYKNRKKFRSVDKFGRLVPGSDLVKFPIDRLVIASPPRPLVGFSFRSWSECSTRCLVVQVQNKKTKKKKNDLSKKHGHRRPSLISLPIASLQKLLGGFQWNLPVRLISMSSCTSTKPNSGHIFGSQLVKKLFAFHQNGKISITLAPGQNVFLLYNWESGFKLDSHSFIGNMNKGLPDIPRVFMFNAGTE